MSRRFSIDFAMFASFVEISPPSPAATFFVA
jgi:hypothetical protein